MKPSRRGGTRAWLLSRLQQGVQWFCQSERKISVVSGRWLIDRVDKDCSLDFSYAEADPLLPPLQETSVPLQAADRAVAGSVTVVEAVAVHPRLSVTVTE